MTKYKIFILYTNAMYTLPMRFCNMLVGEQVIGRAGVPGHLVVTFVPYVSAEDLATLNFLYAQ
jgi:hypothetical protein